MLVAECQESVLKWHLVNASLTPTRYGKYLANIKYTVLQVMMILA